VPFVVSTDGLIGREAKNLLKQIALRLTAKWEQPYSVVRGFVNARINLAILRATAGWPILNNHQTTLIESQTFAKSKQPTLIQTLHCAIA
jgi:hypothetical protein